MITFIQSKLSTLSTSDGTVTKDVVISSPASEFANIYEEIDAISQLLTLSNYDSFTTEELDAIASDYGLTRLAGTKSTGTAIFRFRSVTNTVIPFGTRISSVGSTSASTVEFMTSLTTTISAAQMSVYLNYSTGFYEITVNIESINIGASNNVASAAINTCTSSITNLDSVINYLPTTGGTDQESNESLAGRIITKKLGNNIGTLTGYVNTVLADNRVLDAVAAGPNDSEMKRNEYGGSVDVYILGTELAQAQDAVISSLGQKDFILLSQPSLNPAGSSFPIISISGSVAGTLTMTLDYNFVKDTGLLAKSVSSQDKIRLTDTGLSKITSGETITINYDYDKLTNDMQAVIDADVSHITASDVLVREATEIPVDVTMEISISSGFDFTTVQSGVITIITDNLNALQLDDDLQRSDLVQWAYEVDGMDKVNLTTLIPAADVVCNKTQYLRAGTITITEI
jgi:uncharacterized phage protein gp47/JayE